MFIRFEVAYEVKFIQRRHFIYKTIISPVVDKPHFLTISQRGNMFARQWCATKQKQTGIEHLTPITALTVKPLTVMFQMHSDQVCNGEINGTDRRVQKPIMRPSDRELNFPHKV